jgi:hypothetical protein
MTEPPSFIDLFGLREGETWVALAIAVAVSFLLEPLGVSAELALPLTLGVAFVYSFLCNRGGRGR